MRFSTGLPRLDDYLGGGIPTKTITLIYGEEKSGKTSLALRISALAARIASAAYIDCSGRLHPERLSQILEANRAKEEKVLVAVVENFLQQEELILRLHDEPPPAPLIVFDDFTALHRIEITGDVKRDMSVYKRLAFQVAALKEAALNRDLAIIIVGQVHEIPDVGESRLVARRILEYWSNHVLRLERKPGEPVGRIFVEKPRKEGFVQFRIARAGLVPE